MGISTTRRRGGVTAGSLEDIDFSELIQMITLGCKTGLLAVQSNGLEGRIWFSGGSVIHADVDGVEGRDAFNRILAWTSGEFSLRHRATCDRQTIEADATLLLMEALRLKDESGDPDGAAEKTRSRDMGGERSPEAEVREVPVGTGGRRRLLMPTTIAVAGLGTVLLLVFLFLVGRNPEPHSAGAVAGSLASAAVLPGPTAKAFRLSRPLESGWPPGDLAARVEADDDGQAPRDEPEIMPDGEPEPTSIDDAPGTGGDVRNEEPDPTPDTGPASAGIVEPSLVGPVRPEPTLPEEESDPGYLEVVALSRVKTGTLVVRVDDREVLHCELSSASTRAWRDLQPVPDECAVPRDELALSAGPREIVAQLIRPGKKDVERALRIDVAPGSVHAYQLILGKTFGRSVVWKALDGPVAAASEGEERLGPAAAPREQGEVAALQGTLHE